MVDENLDEKENSRQSQIEKIQAGLFLTLVTSIGVLSGFGYSVGAVKKRETKEYPKHLEKKLVYLHEQGADLARRALLRATLYTVSGFTLTCLAIWKISGANSFAELRRASSQDQKLVSTTRTPEGQRRTHRVLCGLKQLSTVDRRVLGGVEEEAIVAAVFYLSL